MVLAIIEIAVCSSLEVFSSFLFLSATYIGCLFKDMDSFILPLMLNMVYQTVVLVGNDTDETRRRVSRLQPDIYKR